MARFIGGELQAEFMGRLRGIDPGRCLVVPVDVGKSMAMSLVADHFGEIVTPPFEFVLSESGVVKLIKAVELAERARSAVVVRVGVEAAGHYHRTAVARLRKAGLEVVELNPGRSSRLGHSSCCERSRATHGTSVRWPNFSLVGPADHPSNATRRY
jgi:transposase